MRILATGTSGFIGNAVLARISSASELVTARRKPMRASDIAWDLASEPELSTFPESVDAVIHLAQSDQYRKGAAGASDMFRVNVASTAALLRYAEQAGVKRFCLISTGTVYEPYVGELEEAARVAPESFLGATKLAAEALTLPYLKAMQVCVLRLFFPYGPLQVARMIPDLIDRVRNGTPITLAGEGGGGNIVPTYVDDIADIIATSVEEGWQGTFNVASPQVVSIRDIGVAIGRSVGREPIFEQQPERSPLTVVPELSKLGSLYDLREMTSLEEGLRKTIST